MIMNKRRTFITLLLCALFLTATAQISFSEKMGKQKGTLSMTISKAMLKMVPEMQPGELDLGKIIDRLTSMQIIQTDGKETSKKQALASFRRVVDAQKFENLMTINKGYDEESVVYFRDYGNNCRQFALLQMKKGGVYIIVLTGSLKLEDVQELAQQKRKTARK